MRALIFVLSAVGLVLLGGCGEPDPELVDFDEDGYPASIDCDDGVPAVNPAATEVCDRLDNNCDGQIDEGVATAFFNDADLDGYGDPATRAFACSIGNGQVDNGDDCNDTDKFISPKGDETCDGVDEDCDGETDEDAVDRLTFFADSDRDGYGDAASPVEACALGTGMADNDTDCNDDVASISPDGVEVCDGAVDEDCDGQIDEDDAFDAPVYFLDSDDDGFGDPLATRAACTVPDGYVLNDEDCNDFDGAVFPGADEFCNTEDDDCDGTVDEDDARDTRRFYRDADGDGDGDPDLTTRACTAPSGYVNTGGDCDDADDTVSGKTVWYADTDRDTYGDAGSTRKQCLHPGAGWVLDDTDCDDDDGSVHPGAPEICVSGTSAEGVDNDCDNQIDEDCPTLHCGSITNDETWAANTHGHLVTCSISIQGTSGPTLTIEEGATVAFFPNTSLVVGNIRPGTLLVEGTASKPVTLTSSRTKPRAGDWTGLYFYGNNKGSELTHVTVEYADAPGVYVDSSTLYAEHLTVTDSKGSGLQLRRNARLEMTDSVLSDNGNYGLLSDSSSGILYGSDPNKATFLDNELSGNGNRPAALSAWSVGTLDDSNDFTGNADDRVEIVGSNVGTQTWRDVGVDYFMASYTHVNDAASTVLTIEDGVTIEFAKGAGLGSGSNFQSGRIVVEGSTKGVLFTSAAASPSPGDWNGVYLANNDQGSELTGLEVEYATIGVHKRFSDDSLLDDVHIHDCSSHGVYVNNGEIGITDSTIEDNEGDGVHVLSNSSIDTSDVAFDNNTITGNAGHPMVLGAWDVGDLDPTNDFTGNTKDSFWVHGGAVGTTTWYDHDVPYVLDGNLFVNGSAGPVLTVEDGVHMRFNTGYGFFIGTANTGGLVLDGDLTSGEGILIESNATTPGPGDWTGLRLGNGMLSASTSLAGFEIRHGGRNGTYPATLYAFRSDVTIEDCIIAESSQSGLYVNQGTITVDDCSFEDNDHYGIAFSANGRISSSGFTSTGNKLGALNGPPQFLTGLDGTEDLTGNDEDIVRLYGGRVVTDATWHAYTGVTYQLAGTVDIGGTAVPHVEIETGATVAFENAAMLRIGYIWAGSLEADDVTFTSAEAVPSAGDWNTLAFENNTVSKDTSVTNSTIEYGGYGGSGNLYFNQCSPTITGNTITDSSAWGVWLRDQLTTPTLSGNTYARNSSGDVRRP